MMTRSTLSTIAVLFGLLIIAAITIVDGPNTLTSNARDSISSSELRCEAKFDNVADASTSTSARVRCARVAQSTKRISKQRAATVNDHSNLQIRNLSMLDLKPCL